MVLEPERRIYCGGEGMMDDGHTHTRSAELDVRSRKVRVSAHTWAQFVAGNADTHTHTHSQNRHTLYCCRGSDAHTHKKNKKTDAPLAILTPLLSCHDDNSHPTAAGYTHCDCRPCDYLLDGVTVKPPHELQHFWSHRHLALEPESFSHKLTYNQTFFPPCNQSQSPLAGSLRDCITFSFTPGGSICCLHRL